MPSNPATRATKALTAVCIPDQVDIETLVNAHYSYVLRLAHSILKDAEEAQDVAQETFLSAARGLERFRGEASIKTWLTTITLNSCRSKLRKRKVRQVLQATLEAMNKLTASDPTPENAALQREADARIRQAVDALDDKHRIVVILRYVYELPVQEIARVLKTREGTVHSRLHHARQKLLARLVDQNSKAEVFDGTP